MEMPYELRLAIEQQSQGLKHTQLKSDAQAISSRYRTESGQGKRLLTRENEAVSYSIARMPATYGAVHASLGYALDLADCRPRSLLDVGAGTGAASWAANTLLELDSVVCLEREEAMRSIGRRLMAESHSAALREAAWQRYDLTADELTVRADLVVASYVLNELSESGRRDAVEELWQATDMLLLLVEPGTPAGYANLLAARTLLLEQGGHLVAPCPHQLECPMAAGDWCHFKARVPRSRLHRQLKDGDAPYEDEKYIYMAVARSSGPRAEARIIRHPLKEKGRITLELCRPEGLGKLEVTKKDGPLFKAARKSDCGDEFSLQVSSGE
ncbi:small ribosomal subunit Rsm22 family protein [Paenibacillus tengchongensis]|uniref:small ribosomal subunit Rsm22 family protein n=1 Tax=Paenibacillus tengchongensis TaxID=2608684 RepID=UPI00124EDDA3|nr:small ribosomal subunit Rsm22 family protein [Paenibacillus tengchongensis]